MDTKRTYLFMLLAFMLMMGWQMFTVYERNRHPEWKWPDSTDQANTTPAPSTATTSNAVSISNLSSTQAAISVQGAASASEMYLGSPNFRDKQYAMGLSFSGKGAAVESVVLNQFRAEAGSSDTDLFRFQTTYPGDDGAKFRPIGVYSVTVDGQNLELWDQDWQLHPSGDGGAPSFSLDVLLNQAPAVRITETITIPRIDQGYRADGGYELLVAYNVTNLSDHQHTVKLTINGPTVPKATTSRDIPSVVEGYDDNQTIAMNAEPPSRLSTLAATKELKTSDKGWNLLWFGSSSNYFCAINRPENPGQFAQFTAVGLGPDIDKDPLVGLRATTGDMVVAAGGQSLVATHVFFGPKQRQWLNDAYYSAYPMSYDKMLVMTGSSCAWMMWDWLVSLLVWMLFAFHFVLRDWGLAIIALVCLVRLILHPITRRSQVSMMKMQKLAPEMERLKKKFGDDTKGYQQAQMELYKEMGFTPVLGCLPMFLQMPVFINLYGALLSTFELRQAPFLRFGWLHLTWIRDLSEPDNLIRFSAPVTIPFLGWHVYGINVLPVLMAVVTFMNQKYLMPPPAVQTPEQEQQRKMMTYTSLLFPLMFYAVPSGLNLYYLTSTGLGIVESWLIRDHIKKREAMDKAGKEFVEVGKATRASRTRKIEQEKPVKKTGLSGWLADLQAKVEDMRRENPGKRKN